MSKEIFRAGWDFVSWCNESYCSAVLRPQRGNMGFYMVAKDLSATWDPMGNIPQWELDEFRGLQKDDGDDEDSSVQGG